jgi:hypothetical protein
MPIRHNAYKKANDRAGGQMTGRIMRLYLLLVLAGSGLMTVVVGFVMSMAGLL